MRTAISAPGAIQYMKIELELRPPAKLCYFSSCVLNFQVTLLIAYRNVNDCRTHFTVRAYKSINNVLTACVKPDVI